MPCPQFPFGLWCWVSSLGSPNKLRWCVVKKERLLFYKFSNNPLNAPNNKRGYDITNTIEIKSILSIDVQAKRVEFTFLNSNEPVVLEFLNRLDLLQVCSIIDLQKTPPATLNVESNANFPLYLFNRKKPLNILLDIDDTPSSMYDKVIKVLNDDASTEDEYGKYRYLFQLGTFNKRQSVQFTLFTATETRFKLSDYSLRSKSQPFLLMYPSDWFPLCNLFVEKPYKTHDCFNRNYIGFLLQMELFSSSDYLSRIIWKKGLRFEDLIALHSNLYKEFQTTTSSEYIPIPKRIDAVYRLTRGLPLELDPTKVDLSIFSGRNSDGGDFVEEEEEEEVVDLEYLDEEPSLEWIQNPIEVVDHTPSDLLIKKSLSSQSTSSISSKYEDRHQLSPVLRQTMKIERFLQQVLSVELFWTSKTLFQWLGLLLAVSVSPLSTQTGSENSVLKTLSRRVFSTKKKSSRKYSPLTSEVPVMNETRFSLHRSSSYRVTISQLEQLALPGDIVLFACNNLPSKFQRFVLTNCAYDHVGIIVSSPSLPSTSESKYDDLHILEASGQGTKMYKLKQRLLDYGAGYTESVSWRKLMLPYEERGVDLSLDPCSPSCILHQRPSRINLEVGTCDYCIENVSLRDNLETSLSKFASRVVGKRYSLSLRKIFRVPAHFSSKKHANKNTGDEKDFFCSELLACAYREMGLLPEHIDAMSFWPNAWVSTDDPYMIGSTRLSDGVSLTPEISLDCRKPIEIKSMVSESDET
jgi:hypothetical protein